MLPADGDTLFLVVPTPTRQYEEDKESRIRMRYALQRALIDQGFAAEPGDLLSSLEFELPAEMNEHEAPHTETTFVSHSNTAYQTIASEEKLRAPVQFFTQRPLQARLFKGSVDSRFKCVAVIWLPEVHAWRRTAGNKNQYLDVLVRALDDSVNRSRFLQGNDSGRDCDRDRWVFLGPSDSDGLAFYQKYPPYFISNSVNLDLSIVPYRATIANPILGVLPKVGDSTPAPAEFKPLLRPLPFVPDEALKNAVPMLRLNNGDDMLCAELLRAIRTAGSLPPHPRTIHVTVFAEWDTLYGRALSETFAALASARASNSLGRPNQLPSPARGVGKRVAGPPTTRNSGRSGREDLSDSDPLPSRVGRSVQPLPGKLRRSLGREPSEKFCRTRMPDLINPTSLKLRRAPPNSTISAD